MFRKHFGLKGGCFITRSFIDYVGVKLIKLSCLRWTGYEVRHMEILCRPIYNVLEDRPLPKASLARQLLH
jgi:hypothetical protein